MSRHKVKSHNWIEGILRTEEFLFDSIEEAMNYATTSAHHVVKVYNEHGELVHNAQNAPVPDTMSAELAYA